MSKNRVLALILFLAIVCVLIIMFLSHTKNPSDYSDNIFTFEGFVVDKIDDGTRYKILVVNSITKNQAIEWETIDVLKNYIESEDASFFSVDEQNYASVSSGDRVIVTWESNGVFTQGKYPELGAKKIEIIE